MNQILKQIMWILLLIIVATIGLSFISVNNNNPMAILIVLIAWIIIAIISEYIIMPKEKEEQKVISDY